MKKLALVAAAAVFSTSALAGGFGTEDTFYLRVDGGMSMLQKTSDAESYKWKGKSNGYMGLGTGYYLLDNVRAELNVAYQFSPKLKSKTEGNVKSEGRIVTLMPKVYVDMFEIGDMGAAFVGAGVGVSRISEKVKDGAVNVTVKTKNSTKPAFSFGAGVGADVAEGVKMEARYDWTLFGKTASKKVGNFTYGGTKYKAHQATLGLRFDI